MTHALLDPATDALAQLERALPATGLDAAVWRALFDAALAVRLRAYAPYSRFAVGAAVLDERGRIHAGCNVENAAYPQGVCAEAAALAAMVASGGTRVQAALVLAEAAAPVTPCGGCRQKLREFAPPATPIVSADPRAPRALYTMDQLLPASFGPAHFLHPHA